MSAPLITRPTVVPPVVAGAGAQLAHGLLFLLLPTIPVLTPLVALLLTAGAARIVTRNLYGAAVPRAGLVVGAVSAGIGLLFSGLGLIALLIAGLTILAGIAGAVAGRPELRSGTR